MADALTEATGRPPVLIANAPDAATWAPGLACRADVVQGAGALGGLLTAVDAAAPVVCVAWDMPFVTAALLRALGAALDHADAVLPESDGPRGVEPLCAAYGPACGPAMRAALARGDQRAIGFHDAVRVRRLATADVLQYGDPGVLFFNVNTPDDLLRAESLWQAQDSSR